MTHLSLFSGIGGIDLAAHWAGFETVAFVERDPFCQRVLAKHWPEVPIYDDVTTFDPSPYRGVDLVSGGFPCQDVSVAGNRAGIEGERSGLFTELVRVIRAVRPRFALLENVSGLLTDGLGAVLGALAESGLDAEWSCIPASAVGAPQIRERVFILAYPHGFGLASGEIQRAYIAQELSASWRDDLIAARGSGRARLYPRFELQPLDHGVPGWMDEFRAYGNAVVPQQVYPILQAIASELRAQDQAAA
jgi:DNA (cytosine-5)-methyltransferase 1